MVSKLELFLSDEKKAAEPALRVGTLTGSVAGILSILVVLFPNLLTNRQTLIILVISAFTLPIITAVLTRGKVWSPASVEDVIEEAVKGAEDVIKNKRGL